MIHRHLDYPAGTPLAELGAAALDDLLDRGDLADWRPLAQAIAADPFGDLAARVLDLCAANPRYGTSPLWRAWVARRRALAMGAQSSLVPPTNSPVLATTLAEIRLRQGLSQAELAARIGMSQSDLSKAERRMDWKLSTISAIVAGLGLTARLVIFEDERGRVLGVLEGERRG